MSDHLAKNVLLVGAGIMAREYAKVLNGLAVPFTVVGRGQASADGFEQALQVKVNTGGLASYFRGEEQRGNRQFKLAIVAVGVDQLAEAGHLLIEKGVERILIEKPAGLSGAEIKGLAEKCVKTGTSIWVAYNRRFYSSVLKAREIIQNDGGVRSFQFEFTEWAHVIEALDVPQSVKQRWFLANSTHVVDMAFFLGGKPREIVHYAAGGLEWHPAASIFAGAGVSDSGALFSYQANWAAPGRWGVEVLTGKHRLIFKPLEKLQLQKLGSVAVEFLDIDDAVDTQYKPGLFKQVQQFLNPEPRHLCTIQEQAAIVDIYNKMAHYADR